MYNSNDMERLSGGPAQVQHRIEISAHSGQNVAGNEYQLTN